MVLLSGFYGATSYIYLGGEMRRVAKFLDIQIPESKWPAVIDRCTPNPNAIPWLKLGAVSASGPGIFDRVAFIQRVNTVGGMAPATGGTVIGEEARIPYTAEYDFYRAP